MWGPPEYNFLPAQMSAKRGLRQFRQEGGRCTDERTTAAHPPVGDAPM